MKIPKHIIKDSIREAFYTKKDINEELLLLEESSRQIDLWLENKTLINESMNVHISGADYERLDTLGNLSWKLMAPVWKFLETLPKDQLAYYMKNRMPEPLTPDGDDYFKPTGTLNFYTSGFTKQALTGTLKIIFDGLKKLGIKYGNVKTEQSGAYKSQVMRIPILANPHHGAYKGPPELNMSNINAYHIFHNVLQYEGENDFSMEAKELMQRIETLAHDQGWIEKNIIKPEDSDWPEAERDENDPDENPHLGIGKQLGNKLGGARMIMGGLNADDIRIRLREIWKVAKWAVDHGYNKLSVG